MPFTIRVSFYSIALSLSLIGSALAQIQSFSSAPHAFQSSAELEARAVVEKYFALYVSKDLDGLMGLWSAKIPDPGGKRKAIEKQLASLDVSINNLSISRVK